MKRTALFLGTILLFALVPIFGSSGLYPLPSYWSEGDVANWAQPRIASGPVLPSPGIASEGDLFLKIGSPSLLYQLASGAWMQVGDSGGGGATATPGGDLSGSVGSATVVGIQGRAASSTAPADGQVWKWSATASAWLPQTLPELGVATPGGDLAGTVGSATVVGLQGRAASSTAPQNGQVLRWIATASAWVPQWVGGIASDASLPATSTWEVGDLFILTASPPVLYRLQIATTTTTESASDSIPAMINYSAPSGLASATSEQGGHPAWQAFDDDPGTYYQAEATTALPEYIAYQFAAPVQVQKYVITSTGDGDYPSPPASWTFDGSNDGLAWVTLDSRTGVSGWASGTPKTYTFTASSSYTWFRLNVAENYDASPFGFCVLELEMMAIESADIKAWFPFSGGAASVTLAFLDLTDTPDSFAGQAGKITRVNGAGTALEFGGAHEHNHTQFVQATDTVEISVYNAHAAANAAHGTSGLASTTALNDHINTNVPVASGGTGATTAAAARANLGTLSLAEANASEALEFRLDGSRVMTGTLNMGENGIVASGDRTILNLTTDGFDTGSFRFNGGGGVGSTRGADVFLTGNEDGNQGDIFVSGGNRRGNVYLQASGTTIFKGSLATSAFENNLTTSAPLISHSRTICYHVSSSRSSSSDNVATAVFAIHTTNESGSNDGGAYSVRISGLIAVNAIPGSGGGGALFSEWGFSRMLHGNGTSGATSAICQVASNTSASVSGHYVYGVAVTASETTEFDLDVLFQTDVSLAQPILYDLKVELNWGGLLSTPTISVY